MNNPQSITFTLRNGTVLPLAKPLTAADIEDMTTEASNAVLECIAVRLDRRTVK